MKKQHLSILVAVTLIFIAFTSGFFLGRNQNHETVFLSKLPTAARHDASPIDITQPDSPTDTVSFPVDLNSAGAEELAALPGIGPTLAERILEYRSANGPFASPEELLCIQGIGAGKLEAILDYVITGG